MENEEQLVKKEFTWRIVDFSKLRQKSNRVYSDIFSAGGHRWRILACPRGNNVNLSYLSVYLEFVDPQVIATSRWNVAADFTLTLVDQLRGTSSLHKSASHVFDDRMIVSGFNSFVSTGDLTRLGLLVKDTLIFKASVFTKPRAKEAACNVPKPIGAYQPRQVSVTKPLSSESQTMTTKFTWTTINFSKLKHDLDSDTFLAGGHRWMITMLLPEITCPDFVYASLDFADSKNMAEGWSVTADFSLTLVNQLSGNLSVKISGKHKFQEKDDSWRFKFSVSTPRLGREGFILNDTLIFEAEISNIKSHDMSVTTSPCSSRVQLAAKNLMVELSTMANSWKSTSGDRVIVSTDDASGDPTLLQQQREKLDEFLEMSLEAICQSNMFDSVHEVVLKISDLATDPFQKKVLKDLLSRLVEFKNSTTESLSIIETSPEIESSSAQTIKKLEGSLPQRQKQLTLLDSEVSRIQEEKIKVEAEIQLLVARKDKLDNEKNSREAEMEVANREASRELGELKRKHREHDQARDNRLRAKERLAQNNVSWKLFKENLRL